MTPTTRATPATTAWRKSSHSGDEGACVEVAVVTPVVRDSLDTVAVRDSKDPAGPVLFFGPATWTAFTTAPPTRPES